MLPQRQFLVSSLALVLTALAAAPARAAWPHDPSANVLISSTVSNVSPHACISDGAGGAIIGWIDTHGGGMEVYAQRLSPAGAPMWAAGGVPVTSGGTGSRLDLVATSDGAGGIVLVWADTRNGNSDVYAQRVDASGVVHAGWPVNGVRLSTQSTDDSQLQAIPDGTGGAIVAYTDQFSISDYDIYAQRVNGSGAIAPGWNPSYGVQLSIPFGLQEWPALCTDGAGGAIVAWEDNRGGNYDIYAARVTAGGSVPWTTNGVPVNTSAFDQRSPLIVADNAGGALVTWQDQRSGNIDAYLQRIVNATGAAAPGWTGTGTPVCTASDDDVPTSIVADGSNGALVAMHSRRSGVNDIYLQHITASGGVAAGWPGAAVGGVAVCTAGNPQNFPFSVPDGAGGAVLAWLDGRGPNYDVYAARVTGAGSLAAGWAVNGAPVSIAAGDQSIALLCADGAGGAIVAWQDPRDPPFNSIYAQRIERFGQLGNPEPAITKAKDVANDEGGRLKLTWSPSWLDADPLFGIANYWVWRSVPGSVAAAALARGAAVMAADDVAPRPGVRTIKYTTVGATAYAWEFVASQPAQAFPSYSLTIATTSDSTAASNPYTVFMVEAKPPSGNAYWSSAPDSGYSVDNLAPATPAPFNGEWLRTSGTMLEWGANQEPDLAAYRLHRGSSAGFVPGPGNQIAALGQTSFLDALGDVNSYYKLAAVDVHGNLSGYALLSPSGTVDAPAAALPRELALTTRGANPVSGELALRLALPRGEALSLAVYDAAGRRVRTLLSGAWPAGTHEVTWDGRDQAGRMTPSGLYLVRLEAEGRAIVRRVTTLR
jgi:hypothetical protein